MKKLMMAVAIVCAAAGVQAASYSWNFGNMDLQDSTGAYMDGGTAFLFYGTVAASDSAFDFSKATLLTLGGQNGDPFYDYGFTNPTVGNLLSSDTVTSTGAGQAFSVILIEKTDATQADLANFEGNYILATGTSVAGNIPDASGGQTTYFARFADTTAYTKSDWKTMAAVPEPTSGLLLLLGVAGLALRRRRA